jgi:hypothetical protein
MIELFFFLWPGDCPLKRLVSVIEFSKLVFIFHSSGIIVMNSDVFFLPSSL